MFSCCGDRLFRAGSIICRPGIPWHPSGHPSGQALEAKKHWAVQQKLADSERFHTTASWQKSGGVAGRGRSSGQGGFAVDMSEINRKSDSKDGDLM